MKKRKTYNTIPMEKPTQWSVTIDSKYKDIVCSEAKNLEISYSDFLNMLFARLDTQQIFRVHKSEILKKELRELQETIKKSEDLFRSKQKELSKLEKEIMTL